MCGRVVRGVAGVLGFILTVLTIAVPSAPVYAVGQSAAEIREALVAQIVLETGDYRVSVRELGGDNRVIEIESDHSMEPASSIKLFYAWLALRKVDEGSITLSRRLPSGQTWGRCLRVMIEMSDNLCSADIREALGNRKVNRALANAGFSNTRIVLDSNGTYVGKRSSTADFTEFLARLEAGTLLSADSTSRLHELLRNQIWRARIAGGTPTGVVVESKPGVLEVADGMVGTDAAIVRGIYSTYAISIMGEHGATKSAFRRLSRIVYEGLQGVTDYVAATYPRQQYSVPAGTAFRETYGGSAIRLDSARNVTLYDTSRLDAYVRIYGLGTGWVSVTRLTLRDAYRWLG